MQREKYIFRNPDEDLRRRLICGGGVCEDPCVFCYLDAICLFSLHPNVSFLIFSCVICRQLQIVQFTYYWGMIFFCLYNHTFLQMCTQMTCIFTLFSSCTTSTNFVERRDGLVVIEEMVEENAHLEFYRNVCFKTEHQLGLQGWTGCFCSPGMA